MPDLSKRPARYATAFVAVALTAGYTMVATDVRIGAGSDLTALETRNAELRKKLTAAEQEVVDLEERANGTCAAYGTQEEAQAVFDVDPAAFPEWDGNGNGVACEQLKSDQDGSAVEAAGGTDGGTDGTTTSAATGSGGREQVRTRTVTQRVSANSSARRAEPKAPASQSPGAVSSKPTAPSKAEIVASRQHFGMFTATTEEFDDVETSLARDATIHGYFQGWDTPFRAEQVNSSWSRGEIPLLSWESRPFNATETDTTDWSLDAIAAGQHDAYVRQFAKDLRANGLPVVLRFDHEMNGNWYRWTEANPAYGNSKGYYIAAWRHVHNLFAAEGANDLVVWTWSPNRVDNISRLPSIDNYYPGDEYVDWVGMTAYKRPEDPKDTTFTQTFGKTLDELRRVAPGKPILLSEIGATETGGNKLTWVNNFFPGLAAARDVVGFVWFNHAISEDGRTNDWRIQSSTEIVDAFRAGLYATGYGRDAGKQPGLVTTPPRNEVPTPAPSTAPTASPSPTASPTPTPTASPTTAPTTPAARPTVPGATPSPTAP